MMNKLSKQLLLLENLTKLFVFIFQTQIANIGFQFRFLNKKDIIFKEVMLQHQFRSAPLRNLIINTIYFAFFNGNYRFDPDNVDLK